MIQCAKRCASNHFRAMAYRSTLPVGVTATKGTSVCESTCGGSLGDDGFGTAVLVSLLFKHLLNFPGGQ